MKLGDAHKLQEAIRSVNDHDFKFDTVIAVHSLEHCHSPRKVLQEVYAVLQPGGKFGIRAPLQKDLTHQRNKPGKYGELPPHFCVLTAQNLETWLVKEGFNIKFFEVTENRKEVRIVVKK